MRYSREFKGFLTVRPGTFLPGKQLRQREDSTKLATCR
jgi:hypothetical protein